MSDQEPKSADRAKENDWMAGWDKPDVIRDAAAPPPESEKVKNGRSATVDRLARDLGVEPRELAEKYSADTLRRLKYPVRVTVEPDGTRRYDPVVVVAEGPTALVRR